MGSLERVQAFAPEEEYVEHKFGVLRILGTQKCVGCKYGNATNKSRKSFKNPLEQSTCITFSSLVGFCEMARTKRQPYSWNSR